MFSSVLCSYHRVVASSHPLPSSPPSFSSFPPSSNSVDTICARHCTRAGRRSKRSPALSDHLWGERHAKSLPFMGSEGGMHGTSRRPKREELSSGELGQASQRK